jgi:hypothetical protein
MFGARLERLLTDGSIIFFIESVVAYQVDCNVISRGELIFIAVAAHDWTPDELSEGK